MFRAAQPDAPSTGHQVPPAWYASASTATGRSVRHGNDFYSGQHSPPGMRFQTKFQVRSGFDITKLTHNSQRSTAGLTGDINMLGHHLPLNPDIKHTFSGAGT